MPQPTVLTVTKFDGYYRFGLRRPHQMERGTVASWDVHVHHDAVLALCQMLAREVDSANRDAAPPAVAAFTHKGRGLHDALLSRREPGIEQLRRALRDLNTPLLISSDAPEIYWELMTADDEDGIFGLKYSVGRQLITRGVPGMVRRRDHPWRALIIGDPNFDEPGRKLPAAAKEAARLRDWLGAHNINCDDCLIGPSACFETVLGKFLERSYDIVHYAGHIVPDTEQGGYAFVLHGGRLFSSHMIRNHVQGAPGVFLNGCWSGRSETDPVRSVEGLTDAFLGAGAQFVVGSLFQVPDEGACLLAEKFYEFALNRHPVGEALRLARGHVLKEAGCGAAWACYVLYGDPCLLLEVDALQHALREIGLSRGQFTAPCCAVLGRALEFAGEEGAAGSGHLFAALLDSGEPFLFDGLYRQGIPPESLRDAFRSILDVTSAGHSGVSTDPSFSESSAQILTAAGAVPGGGGSGSVTARDVAKAFVRYGGGSAGALMVKLGIDLAAMDTDSVALAVSAGPPAELFIGRLGAASCDADSWGVLQHASELAFENGVGFVGTPQLFAALVHGSGALAARARALGFDLPEVPPRRRGARALSGPNVACSGNVSEVLLAAKAYSASQGRDCVTIADILAAFVRQGGGEIGRSFRSEGRIIELLTTDLFLDSGDIDNTRFEEPSQRAISLAVTCARAKGSARLDRFHFLHGMLTGSGEMSRRCSAQGFRSQTLAERLYTRIPSEWPGISGVGSNAREMEPELLRILFIAAGEGGGSRAAKIGDSDLLAGWFREGGGAAGEFLIDCGVSMAALAVPCAELPSAE